MSEPFKFAPDEMIRVVDDHHFEWARGALFKVVELEPLDNRVLVSCILQHDLSRNSNNGYKKGERFRWFQDSFESCIKGICKGCINGCKENDKEQCDFKEVTSE